MALLQVFAIIVGVFMTRVAFFNAGYPDSGAEWNRWSMVVRNYGFLLLLIPAMWTAVATYLEQFSYHRWSRHWTLCSGFFVLASLVAILCWSCSHTYNGRVRITQTDHASAL